VGANYQQLPVTTSGCRTDDFIT